VDDDGIPGVYTLRGHAMDNIAVVEDVCLHAFFVYSHREAMYTHIVGEPKNSEMTWWKRKRATGRPVIRYG